MLRRTALAAALLSVLAGCGGSSGGTGTTSNGNGSESNNQDNSTETITVAKREWQKEVLLSSPTRDTTLPVIQLQNENGSAVLYSAWVEEANNGKPDELYASVAPIEDYANGNVPNKVKISADIGEILRSDWQPFIVDENHYKSSVQMSLSNHGNAYITWVQRDNSNNQKLNVSYYDATTQEWSPPLEVDHVLMTDAAATNEESRVKITDNTLFTDPSGKSIVIWQTPIFGSDTNALEIAWLSNDGTKANIIATTELSRNIKTNSDGEVKSAISIHSVETSPGVLEILSIEKGADDENDVLAKHTVKLGPLNTPVVERSVIDDDGVKSGLASINTNLTSYALWSESRGSGSSDLIGVTWRSDNSGYSPISGIPNISADAGQASLTSTNGDVHAVWRQRDNVVGNNIRTEKLMFATLEQSIASNVTELNSNGAIYPRLFSGNDDKLYTTWNGEYFHIKEAYIESGDIHWQETYRPSCDPTTAIDDLLCGLGVRERYSAMVDGDYGAMSWLKDVNGTKSVFISISTN